MWGKVHIDETLKRGKRLEPLLKTVVIAYAGHALIVDQPGQVNHEILKFLEELVFRLSGFIETKITSRLSNIIYWLF